MHRRSAHSRRGPRGVVRRQRHRTTNADSTAEHAQDLVQRQFYAERPDQLWVADFTYGATRRGGVNVAFVIDVFSRRIVGWSAHTTIRADLVLEAIKQALHDRFSQHITLLTQCGILPPEPTDLFILAHHRVRAG